MNPYFRIVRVAAAVAALSVPVPSFAGGSRFVRTAPSVSAEMLSPSFWESLDKKADEVILSADEILAVGKEAASAAENDEMSFFHYASGRNGSVTQSALLAFLDADVPERCYKDGDVVPDDLRKRLSASRNLSAVGESNPVSYGVILRRGNVRLLPTDEILTGEEFALSHDILQAGIVMMSEPVVVLHSTADSSWHFVVSATCRGWVPDENLAFCHNFAEWDKCRNPADFLVVTESRFSLDHDRLNARISGAELFLGTKLALVPYAEWGESAEGREGYDCYIVRIPDKSQGGFLMFHNAYVPCSRSVSVGYVPYTRANLLRISFSCLGERFGWRGMYGARDDAQFVTELYRVFGFDIPRSVSGIAAMDVPTIGMRSSTSAHKKSLLKYVPAGSILVAGNRVLLYLGTYGGEQYALSTSESDVLPGGRTARTMGVSVLPLSAGIPSAGTLADEISAVKVMY